MSQSGTLERLSRLPRDVTESSSIDAAASRLRDALADRYLIERELGRGGMAVVYLARELRHPRTVAIKVLRPEIAHFVGERFIQEIRVTCQLTHPHILPLLESGEADGQPFYVMPYVAGETLRQRLEREAQLPLDEAISIARQIASALDYAHGMGVVHRDIKPENILLVHGEVLVADFGLARALDTAASTSLTESGMSVGTPAYMSPEQASGERHLDGRADVYSLGCVLYEMITGLSPYQGTNAQAIVAQHLTATPPSVRRVRANCPAAVDDTIQRALGKAPADRFRTAGEMMSAMGDEPVAARGPRVGVRSPLARFAVVALLTLAIGLVGLFAARGSEGLSFAGLVRGPHQARADQRSLVVLPFANIGGDTAAEYFSDGMADELSSALGSIPSLRVISRTSAFSFKGRNVDVRDVGRQLGATHVLEGAVQRSGPRLRVHIQLIRSSDGTVMWTNSYERALQDLFAVQDDISHSVARELQLQLGEDGASQSPQHRRTDNLAAYDLYLRGQFYENKGDEPSLRKSLSLYRQALELDPNYAPAWVGIAEAYGWMSDEFLAPDASLPQSEEAARRAISLDPSNASAHAVLANALLVYRRDLNGTARELDRAFAQSANPGTGFVGAGIYFIAVGKSDSAIKLLRGMEAVDPLNAILKGWTAWMLESVNRYDESIDEARQALELDPSNPYAYLPLGDALRAKGKIQDAVDAYRKGLGLGNRARAALAVAYGELGQRPQALALLDSLLADAKQHYVGADVIASVYAALGQNDEAFRWLDKGLKDHCGQLIFAGFDHRWDPLRGDPRFATLMQKLGLSVWRHAS